MIICASDVITFQICSVLSGKLNSPAYLQENKCTSYCLLENTSWAVWFFSFQWACCDFVLTDWAVFHFAFIFHPVKRIFSAFFFPSPASCCLYGSVHWSSDSFFSALLVCSFPCCRDLSWTFPMGSSGQTLVVSVGSIFCRGQDMQERWVSLQVGERLKQSENVLYFSLDLCCVSSDPPWGAACLWLDHLHCSGSAVQKVALPSVLQRTWDGGCSQLQKLVWWSWFV